MLPPRMRPLFLLPLLCLPACSLSGDLPQQPPPLANVEEPLDLRAEPADEGQRAALPPGSFSGIVLEDGRATLAEKLGEPAPLRVAQVVENSPAAFAGVAVDDLLLEVKVGDGAPAALRRPSDWRAIELGNAPGTALHLVLDRAGREAATTLQLAARARPAARTASERFREETRVGVVLRTATEVEARGAGLPPGAGAVIVGLSAQSPWRGAGLRFADLLVAVDGHPVAHPQDLLDALRDPARTSLRLDYRRNGVAASVDAPLSRRATETREIYVPLLFDYSRTRGATEWSCLFSIVSYHSTAAAWRLRLFWLIGMGGGDADRLLEVDK